MIMELVLYIGSDGRCKMKTQPSNRCCAASMAQGHFPENQFDEREKSFPPTVSLAQVDLGYCGSAGKGIEPLPGGQGANDATSRATVPDPSIKWLSQQLCFSTTAVMGMVCV